MLHDVIYWFGLICGLCLLTAVLLGVGKWSIFD